MTTKKKVTKKKVTKKVVKKALPKKADLKIAKFIDDKKTEIVVGPALGRGLQMDTLRVMRKVASWMAVAGAPSPDVVGLGNLIWEGKLQLRVVLQKRRFVVSFLTPDGIEQVFKPDRRKDAIAALSSIFS